MSNTSTVNAAQQQLDAAKDVVEQAAMEVAARTKLVDDALAKLALDAGALFEEEVLNAIRLLRTESPAHYARIKAKAKAANQGVVAELDRLTEVAEDLSDKDIGRLITLAKLRCTLAHTEDREGVAIIELDDRTEVWLVRGDGFSEWLRAEYYSVYKEGVSRSTLDAALNTIEAIGVHGGQQVEVHLRTAKHGDAYYIDLCDERWRAVRIDAKGVEVIDRPPVLFTRNQKMRPLPVPEAGGSLDVLWKYVNVPATQRPLVVAFVLDAMRPDTPYPVLEIVGEQGSAKSTAQRYLRDLIDPNKVPLRGAPDSSEDIFVSAANNGVVSYENLSFLSNEIQDALCTLATGGGYATRKFYTNGEEHVLETKRPVMLNSISGVVSRPDLIERTVRVEAPTIAPSERREESDLEKGWTRDRAKIFGAVLHRFAEALALLPSIALVSRHRMADFQRLGEALMQAENRPAGEFSTLYGNALRDGTERALENYGVVAALVALMDGQGGRTDRWAGTVGVLYSALDAESRGMDRSNWPKSARGLSDQLKRLAPALRAQGLEVQLGDRTNKGRLITITRLKTGDGGS